ncbi:MAG: BREX-3 system P-loop-containing protein BrxF [Opitutaceae bacterium]|nr:BREX-3 system P-loop-containing protein BrxF [Verrucomicrobiales bacterium]
MKTDFQQALAETMRHASSARHRLVLVVGEAGSGKTAFLQSIATAHTMQFLSLGEPLGIRLLEASPRTRPLVIEENVRQLLNGDSRGVCIDTTDILFSPDLRCDPLRLACSISQNMFVAFSLTGRVEGKRFIRGYPDHPEFYSEELPSIPVIILNRSEATFHAY